MVRLIIYVMSRTGGRSGCPAARRATGFGRLSKAPTCEVVLGSAPGFPHGESVAWLSDGVCRAVLIAEQPAALAAPQSDMAQSPKKTCFLNAERPCDLTCKAAFEVDDPVDNVDCYFIWLSYHGGEALYELKRLVEGFRGFPGGGFPGSSSGGPGSAPGPGGGPGFPGGQGSPGGPGFPGGPKPPKPDQN